MTSFGYHIDDSLQMQRIIFRNGEAAAQNFKAKWIPMEEKYIAEFLIKDKADFVIHNVDL